MQYRKLFQTSGRDPYVAEVIFEAPDNHHAIAFSHPAISLTTTHEFDLDSWRDFAKDLMEEQGLKSPKQITERMLLESLANSNKHSEDTLLILENLTTGEVLYEPETDNWIYAESRPFDWDDAIGDMYDALELSDEDLVGLL